MAGGGGTAAPDTRCWERGRFSIRLDGRAGGGGWGGGAGGASQCHRPPGQEGKRPSGEHAGSEKVAGSRAVLASPFANLRLEDEEEDRVSAPCRLSGKGLSDKGRQKPTSGTPLQVHAGARPPKDTEKRISASLRTRGDEVGLQGL